jgi:excisionase family DNA binding protein
MAKKNKKVRIYSALEVANICGVVNQTAINWIKNNYLKAFTTPGGQYRIYAENLLEFLKARGMKVPQELKEIDEDGNAAKSILIVDDDSEINDMLKEYFEQKFPNSHVYQAFDGFEAGKLVNDKKPRVIILDVDLPGIDGHRLCQRIKQDGELDKPLVISITGLNDSRVKVAVLKAGADAFFAKPLDFEEIAAKIEQYFEQ